MDTVKRDARDLGDRVHGCTMSSVQVSSRSSRLGNELLASNRPASLGHQLPDEQRI
jgi:hypothetical protein